MYRYQYNVAAQSLLFSLFLLMLQLVIVEPFSSLPSTKTRKLWIHNPLSSTKATTVIDDDVDTLVGPANWVPGAFAEHARQLQTKDQPKQSSRALESMLKTSGSDMTISSFFQTTWQKSPALFRKNSGTEETITVKQQQQDADGVWSKDKMQSQPYEELIRQGWYVLTDLLEQPAVDMGSDRDGDGQPAVAILNGNVQHPREWMPFYGMTSLYAPYVNGSSLNQPHADWKSPWLAAFCEDLQQTFPYVYANTYLTPPQSKAMNLHADDREVFVVQLVGSKEWEVMKEVPVAFPYSHEQFGKDDLEIPSNVINGGASITCTLKAGDVLYIPRGHCHHAKCTDDLSFHVTIAVPTFDWSLAGMIHATSQSILANVEDNRKGILPIEALDDTEPNKVLQRQIDNAIELLRENITPEHILNNLQTRLEPHQRRGKRHYEKQFERARATTAEMWLPVGPLAARHVSMSTKVRYSTYEEREQLEELRKLPPGMLHVRNELKDDVSSILSRLQSDEKLEVKVSELKSLLPSSASAVWCDLALLGFVKQAVEAGALSVAD
mmetsp:Transcript_26599/g.39462  ORF Transcript_26599/g.39462 Transcript_26599/m.39462 type:complete len:552 (-) Transcript_26599:83-1738(-)